MNPYYDYHPTFLLPPHYAYGVPIFPVPAPWVTFDQLIPVHYAMGEPYPQFVLYLDDVAILNTPTTMSVNQEPTRSYTQNPYIPYTRPEDMFNVSDFETQEQTLMMLEMEADAAPQRSGSGLSEEEITKRLHVYTAQGNKIKDSEVVTCSICLCDCEQSEKIVRLECGHQYHAECIKRWLLSKNVCPMCRSVALRV